MESQKFCPNIANSIFPSLNDNQGIMLCGYEWGDSEADQDISQSRSEGGRNGVLHSFSNKSAEYGQIANSWKYDQRIIYWFELFGHKLNRIGNGGDFEKCLIQTNWCNSQNRRMDGDYWSKLLDPCQVDNFIAHIQFFKPRLILFFGSQLIKILQNETVLPRFVEVAGEVTEQLSFRRKDSDGRVFNVGFESFENCRVVCFPHPSGSHGLSDSYIGLFAIEVGNILQEFKEFKQIV